MGNSHGSGKGPDKQFVAWLQYHNFDTFDGQGCLDVSEKPVTHLKLTPPPHNGVGRPEDLNNFQSNSDCQLLLLKLFC